MIEGPIVTNVVALTDFRSSYNLHALAAAIPVSDYDPEHYYALIFRGGHGQGSLLVNTSGKVLATGAKSLALAEALVKDFAAALRECGFDADPTPLQVQNLVATFSLPGPIDLPAVGKSLHGPDWTKSTFPGIKIKPGGIRATLLIFASGKVVCIGARTMTDVEAAMKWAEARVTR